ncbi:MAG: hypothetical protein E7270_04495 [Lachnospiraceae bacterium]|nr:hypothetical protein [Lachnospiraceae bacterium]
MKMRNVFYSICLSLVIAFVLLPTTRVEATEINFDDYGSTYAYNALASRNNGSDRQALYNDIYSLAKNFWTNTEDLTDVMSNSDEYVIATIDISEYTLTETDVIETFFSFKNDHPIFYYISNTVWFDGNNNCVYITTDSDYKLASSRTIYNNAILTEIQSFVSETDSLTNISQKVETVHDKIVDNMYYEYDDDGNPSKEAYAHNILGALTKGKGVCESYARTFQLAMNVMDIENYIITGVSNDENHAWNMVKLEDGKYYYVDCTWDDTTSSKTYFLKGSYVFKISHTKNTPQGTGVMYLYDIPDANEDSYLKTFTLSCNGTSLGRFDSVESAFKNMTNSTGKYVIDIDLGATVYAPAGQWPIVKEIRFEGERGGAYLSPVQLLGDATANSDVVLKDVDFDTQHTYIHRNNKLSELNIGKHLLTAEDDVNFGGYSYDSGEEFTYYTGVNIKGNTGSTFKLVSNTDAEAICDIKNEYINVDNISIKDSNLYIHSSSITANKIILDGSIRFLNMLGDTEAGTISAKQTQLPGGTGFVTTQCMAPGCKISLGNVIGNDNALAMNVVCGVKNQYPNISFTNSTARIDFNLINYQSILNMGTGLWTHNVWSEALDYSSVLFNMGSTNIDKFNMVTYTIGKVNSKNEIEDYQTDDIKGLLYKDSKGNVYRKYDENLYIVNGVIKDYTFMDKCTVENLVIPNNVTAINSWAFGQCYSIKNVTIPNSVQFIYDSAFVGTPNLKTVTIPSSVINIGNKALGYNYNIETEEYTKVDGFTIICEKGTVAEAYAIENGINYITIPDKVNKFKVSAKTANSITLRWNKDNSANGYVIKQYKNGKWVDIKKITKKTTTSYKVTGLSAAKSYKFRILAYKSAGGTVLYSKTASTLTGATNPKAVTKLKAAKRTKNSIKLSWTRNKNVNGYVIEMKKGKKWVQVKKITKNSTVTYTKKKLSKKTNYNFRIKTYKKIGSKTYYSTYKTIKAKTK